MLSLTQKFRYLDIKITMYTDLVQTEMSHLSKDTVAFYVIETFLHYFVSSSCHLSHDKVVFYVP